jgi:hypothetical protein
MENSARNDENQGKMENGVLDETKHKTRSQHRMDSKAQTDTSARRLTDENHGPESLHGGCKNGSARTAKTWKNENASGGPKLTGNESQAPDGNQTKK